MPDKGIYFSLPCMCKFIHGCWWMGTRHPWYFTDILDISLYSKPIAHKYVLPWYFHEWGVPIHHEKIKSTNTRKQSILADLYLMYNSRFCLSTLLMDKCRDICSPPYPTMELSLEIWARHGCLHNKSFLTFVPVLTWMFLTVNDEAFPCIMDITLHTPSTHSTSLYLLLWDFHESEIPTRVMALVIIKLLNLEYLKDLHLVH